METSRLCLSLPHREEEYLLLYPTYVSLESLLYETNIRNQSKILIFKRNTDIQHQRIDEPISVALGMGKDMNAVNWVAGNKPVIGIIGLGYVGLPTAIGFHDAGFEVWGVDVSQRTVDMGFARQKSYRRPRC